MTDSNRNEQDRSERDGRSGRPEDGRALRAGERHGEQRSWDRNGEEGEHRRQGGDTAYGRTSVGSGDRSEGYGHSGGYGGQGGFGSQHGQGGYASLAQGSAYGQTSSEWGRSGYGGFDSRNAPSDRSYGGGEAAGFGRTSYAVERDAQEGRRSGSETGARGQGVGEARRPQQGTRDLSYEADYRDYGDDRGRGGASGGSASDDDHEPHYRRWRDQQLAAHDQDYDRWRTEQTKRYDDEYKSYRDTRHQSFTKEFGDWRDKGADKAQPAATPAATPAPGQTAGFGMANRSDLTGEGAVQNVADGGSGHADHDKKDADKAD